MTTNDWLTSATHLSDNRFSRFHDELIDKYFNDEGKKAIEAYIEQKHQQDLVEARRDEWRKYSDDSLMRHFAITYEQLRQNYWYWMGEYRKYRRSELQAQAHKEKTS